MKTKKPPWLNRKIDFRAMHDTESALAGLGLRTVCHQARCPNISECYARGTATFMILGDTCTRGCGFCNVKRGLPPQPDAGEPGRVALAVERMGLSYAVITSVTRDDLDDGGSSHFVSVIENIRGMDSSVSIEVLVPDFRGDRDAVGRVVRAGPDVFAHNIETVPSLYRLRPGADYRRSLALLRMAGEAPAAVKIKSAIMLGLGETEDEVAAVLRELREAGCHFISIGQYLRPGRSSAPVMRYLTPDEFHYFGDMARGMGFLHAESGVYVRSSYMADRYTISPSPK